MSDFAELGLRFTTQGDTQTKTALNDIASGSEKAAKATDGLAASSEKANTATAGLNVGLLKLAAVFGGVLGTAINLITDGLEKLLDHLSEFIKSVVEAGVEGEKTGLVLQVVGANAGWTASQVELVKKAFEEQNIVGAEANESLARLAATGVSAATAQKLAATAANIATLANISGAEATKKLATAIESGSNFGLRSVGIHADLTQALKDEAKALGDGTKTLTESQAAEARANALIQAANVLSGTHARALETEAGKLEVISAQWTKLKEAIGDTFLPLEKTLSDIASDVLISLIAGFKELEGWFEEIANSDLANWTENVLGASFKNFKLLLTDIQPLLDDIGTLFSDLMKSDFANWIGKELVGAFKDLVVGIQDSIYQLRIFAVDVQGIIRAAAAFVDPRLSPQQTVSNILAIGKQADDAKAKINAAHAADVATRNGPQAPRATAATNPIPVRTGGSGGVVQVPGSNHHGRTPTDENQEQIDKATLDQLKALEALTGDLELQHQIKLKEISVDLDNQKEQLKQKVAKGNITAATAATASTLYEEAAQEKTILADRELLAAQIKQELEHQKTMTDYLDRTEKAQAAFAPTVEKRNQLEEDALSREQALETAAKQEADRIAVLANPKLAAAKAEEEAQLKAAQDAETVQKATEDRIAVIKETAQHEQDLLQSKVDVLQSAEDAAQTELERYNISKQILAAEQEIERNKAAAAVAAAEASGIEDDIETALQRQSDLLVIQNNQLKAAAGSFQNNINDLTGSFKSLSQAIKDHDWGSIFDSLDKAITSVEKVFDSLKASSGSSGSSGGGILGSIGKLFGGGGGSSGFDLGVGGLGALGSASGGFDLGVGGLGSLGSIGGAASGLLGTLGSITSFLGPIGAVAGAVTSLFSGLFGGESKAEKRAKENQAAADAIAGQEDIANEKRSLELRLVTASGDQVAILAASRQEELNGISQANQELAKQVQDAEERKARSDTLDTIEAHTDELLGNKQAQLTIERKSELDAIDPLLQGLQKLSYAADDATTAFTDAQTNLTNAAQAVNTIFTQLAQNTADAESKLRTAFNAQISGYQSVIDKMSGYSKSLHDFSDSLAVSSPGLSPQDTYNAAQQQFQANAAATVTGTQSQRDAALSQFQDFAQKFLDASHTYYGNSTQYFKDLDAVKAATQAAAVKADQTVTNVQKQVDLLTQVVGSNIDIKSASLSTVDALKNLLTAKQAEDNAHALTGPLYGIDAGITDLNTAVNTYLAAFSAFQAAEAAQTVAINNLSNALTAARSDPGNQPVGATSPSSLGYRSTNGDYAAYVEGNPDLKAAFAAGTGYAKGRTESEFGLFQWATIGMTEPRPVRPYQFGGDMQIGGSGGTDSQLFQGMMSPGERVKITNSPQQAQEVKDRRDLILSVNALGDKLDQLVVEAKADKNQRAGQTTHLSGKLDQVSSAIGGVKRAVRTTQPK